MKMPEDKKGKKDKAQKVEGNEESLSAIEVRKLKERSAEYLAGWQRAKADYANLQKEKEREHKEIVEFANQAMIALLLPAYTNFKKAAMYADRFQETEDKELRGWIDGIKFIKKQWEDVFKTVGIDEIKTLGEKLDPVLHEAVRKEGDGDGEEIIEEVEPGYTFKGKVVNPAKVVVK